MISEGPDFSTLIKKALSQKMKCGLLSSDEGDLLILHDKELDTTIQWVEFKPDIKELHIIHENGASQNLGVLLDDMTIENLERGQIICLAYVRDQEILNTQNVSLIIQNY